MSTRPQSEGGRIAAKFAAVQIEAEREAKRYIEKVNLNATAKEAET
jgi:hypothetical protein